MDLRKVYQAEKYIKLIKTFCTKKKKIDLCTRIKRPHFCIVYTQELNNLIIHTYKHIAIAYRSFSDTCTYLHKKLQHLNMKKEQYIAPEVTVVVSIATSPHLLQQFSADATVDNWNQPDNYYEEVPAEDY